MDIFFSSPLLFSSLMAPLPSVYLYILSFSFLYSPHLSSYSRVLFYIKRHTVKTEQNNRTCCFIYDAAFLTTLLSHNHKEKSVPNKRRLHMVEQTELK